MNSNLPPPIEDMNEIPSPKDLGYKILDDPTVDITGFEYVRTDSSEITGKMQKALFDVLLLGSFDETRAREKVNEEFKGFSQKVKDEIVEGLVDGPNLEGIVSQIDQDVRNGEYDPRFICRSPSVNAVEDIEDEYDQPPIAARAGHFTDQFFDDVNIQPGDDVYYVYVRSTGYNHDERKLPSEGVIGMIDEMDPPSCRVSCHSCDREEFITDWVINIDDQCDHCGSKMEREGCRVDWEKIAKKSIENKVKKLVKHIGRSDVIDSMGDQESLESFL